MRNDKKTQNEETFYVLQSVNETYDPKTHVYFDFSFDTTAQNDKNIPSLNL